MNAKTLCLAILSFDDAIGYEILKPVEEDPFPHFLKAGWSRTDGRITRSAA